MLKDFSNLSVCGFVFFSSIVKMADLDFLVFAGLRHMSLVTRSPV